MATESKADREAREAQERADALASQTETDAQASTDVEGESHKIAVPGVEGELVFTRGVDEIGRFKVTDGHVTVKGDGQRALILSSVAGSSLVE